MDLENNFDEVKYNCKLIIKLNKYINLQENILISLFQQGKICKISKYMGIKSIDANLLYVASLVSLIILNLM